MTKPIPRSKLKEKNASLEKRLRKCTSNVHYVMAERKRWEEKYGSLLGNYREILLELTKSESRFDNQQQCIEVLNKLLDDAEIKRRGKVRK